MYQVVNGYKAGWVGKGKIYIGRANYKLGLRRSPLANPYRIGKDGDRQEVLRKYRRWLFTRICAGDHDVIRELMAIREKAKSDRYPNGVSLSCYCKPSQCHGDVIKNCLEWIDEDFYTFQELINEATVTPTKH